MNMIFRPIMTYIDPGTGSLLFALFMGIMGAVRYFFKSSWIKVKFLLSGGMEKNTDSEKLPIVIFSDDKRYWNVFGPICDELEIRQMTAEYWTLSDDDPGLDKDYKYVKTRFIGKGNKGYAVLNNMKAKICLSTTPGLDVYQWKRSRDVDKYVHIYHDVTEGMRYRMFGLDYYDTVLLNAKFQERYIRILEEKRGIKKKECVVCGSVYLDDMRSKLEACLKNSENGVKKNTTVLLAPSWGPSAIFSRFGGEVIDALLKTGFDIIIRPHPQSFSSESDIIVPIMKAYPDSDKIKWDRNNSNIEALSKADILISDFSGIVFDYALVFDKPVIVADTEFDPSIYDASWIDEPLWIDQIVDKIGLKLSKDQFNDIYNVILNLIANKDLSESRKQVHEEIWNEHGNAVNNVVNYLTSL